MDWRWMMKIPNDKYFRLTWMILVAGATMFICMAIAFSILPKEYDDPPKQKKEIKKDTTEIDVEQMQRKNEITKSRSLFLDSLIMKIDTTKQKK